MESLGLLHNLKGSKPREMESARTHIDEDKANPRSRLLDWAGLLMSRC